MTEQKQSRLPCLRTGEEEAVFWDTHPLSEFEDEVVIVHRPRGPHPLEHHLSVRRDAAAMGGPSTLALRLRMQRLAQEWAQRAAVTPAPPTGLA